MSLALPGIVSTLQGRQYLSCRSHIVRGWSTSLLSHDLSLTGLGLLSVLAVKSDPSLFEHFCIALVVEKKSTFVDELTFLHGQTSLGSVSPILLSPQ